MSDVLGILDLLKVRGFDPDCRAKLVRHQDRRFDLQAFIRDGWMDLYQAHQTRNIFDNCDYIVSFLGDGSTRAKFLGVYAVTSVRRCTPADIPKGSPLVDWRHRDGFFYGLKHQAQFSDLDGRVVIEWGTGTRTWVQHLRNKPVIEVFPPGRSLDPFTDYLEISLTHAELRELMKNPQAHRDWNSALSAVSGAYLILAETTGHQYIGSAYGLDGIWGRWKAYAANGHGGNKMLQELIKSDDRYPSAFRYSILQVLPKSTVAAEVIRWESRYKLKLGSRATGLNAN